MQVGIFISPLVRPFSGSGSHLKGLLSALSRFQQGKFLRNIVLLSFEEVPLELCSGFKLIVLPKNYASAIMILKRNNIDALHFHPFTIRYAPFLPFFICYATIHGFSRLNRESGYGYFVRLSVHARNFLIGFLSKVFTVSPTAKSILVKQYGVQPDDVIITLNGINDHFIKQEVDKSTFPKEYVLHISNFSLRKNPDGIIKSYALARNLGLQKNLLIVGKGWQESIYVRKLVSDLGLGDHVIFKGFVQDADLAMYYSNAFAFVFPSFYEGFGMPIAEAMYFGIPVITSDYIIIKDLFSEVVTCECPSDFESIASCLLRLMDEDYWSKCSIAGQAFVLDFNWDDAARDTLNVYFDGKIA